MAPRGSQKTGCHPHFSVLAAKCLQRPPGTPPRLIFDQFLIDFIIDFPFHFISLFASILTLRATKIHVKFDLQRHPRLTQSLSSLSISFSLSLPLSVSPSLLKTVLIPYIVIPQSPYNHPSTHCPYRTPLISHTRTGKITLRGG